MEPLAIRQRSAKRLAVDLVGLGGVAFIGASVSEVLVDPVFAQGVLFGAHVLLVGLALLAAILEWTRERWGEAVSVGALGFGFALTIVDAVTGAWFFAPFLGIVTLLGFFALANRYIVRDEQRHAPRVV